MHKGEASENHRICIIFVQPPYYQHPLWILCSNMQERLSYDSYQISATIEIKTLNHNASSKYNCLREGWLMCLLREPAVNLPSPAQIRKSHYQKFLLNHLVMGG
jgi:hypothetical protein